MHDSRGVEIVNFTISFALSTGTLMASINRYSVPPSAGPLLPLLIICGDSIFKATLQLNNDTVGWSSKVKYLGLYYTKITNGADFKIDLSTYGCFNNVIGQQVNEMMLLKLAKTYCLPHLLYGCKSWPTETVDKHELDIIWNNSFRHIFNCCWRESVKPL